MLFDQCMMMLSVISQIADIMASVATIIGVIVALKRS